MSSQLNLMQCFVDDLLDLRQLKDDVFSLNTEPFNVNEMLEQVCEIF